MRLRSETEALVLKTRLASEIEQAKALAENPQLLKLRQLEVIKDLAKGGGKFVIGLQAGELGKAISE